METYICENVFVPLRSGPSHRSEMVSQILFGEKYSITDKAGHWLKIETFFDRYSGWIDKNHLMQSANTEDQSGHVLNRSILCYKNDGTKLNLEAGCEVYNPDFNNKTFTTGTNVYRAADDLSETYIRSSGTIADTAMKFINSPYIWGGRIPSGIDCSGFTQLVYKIHGYNIPRDSKEQADTGETVSFLGESLPGDLAFFDDEKGRISHVGMIISQGLIIHASGRVRIDTIDHQGIYKHEIKGYSHRLRVIKRIILPGSAK